MKKGIKYCFFTFITTILLLLAFNFGNNQSLNVKLSSFHENVEFSEIYNLDCYNSLHKEFNFVDQNDTKESPYISEKEEFDVRERDSLFTLPLHPFISFCPQILHSKNKTFIETEYVVTTHYALYDKFCNWKIPSITSSRM